MKLYEMLQTGLQTTKIYQELIEMEGAPNVLLAGNFNSLPSYTPTDDDGAIRKSLLRKIMGRYYNYDIFTPDTLYFGVRMYWKLNQIMPTYAAKFNALVSPGEFAAVFGNGVKTKVERNKVGSDSSNSKSTGGSSNATNRTLTGESRSTGTVANEGQSTQFNSDYPQVLIGAATDYNSTGGRGQSNNLQTNNLLDNSTNTEHAEHKYTQDLNTERSGSMSENTDETRTRGLSPYEIMLAREKIFKLIMNIEEEITLAVSDLFENVGWYDDDDVCEKQYKKKLDEACKQMLVFAITLNNLNNRINELNFTEEQIGYIGQVPGLIKTTDDLKKEIALLQKAVNELAGQLLPEITISDAGKILMVTPEGTWGAILLPNWATEGF